MTGVLVAARHGRRVRRLLGAPQLGAPFGDVGLLRRDRGGALRPVDRRRHRRSSALLGIAVGYRLYRTLARARPDPCARARVHGARRTSTTSTTSTGRASSGRSETTCPRGVYWNDRRIIDGVVNGAAAFTRTLASGRELVRPEGDRRRRERRWRTSPEFTGGLLRYIQIGQRPAVRRRSCSRRRGRLAVIFTKI